MSNFRWIHPDGYPENQTACPLEVVWVDDAFFPPEPEGWHGDRDKLPAKATDSWIDAFLDALNYPPSERNFERFPSRFESILTACKEKEVALGVTNFKGAAQRAEEVKNGKMVFLLDVENIFAGVEEAEGHGRKFFGAIFCRDHSLPLRRVRFYTRRVGEILGKVRNIVGQRVTPRTHFIFAEDERPRLDQWIDSFCWKDPLEQLRESANRAKNEGLTPDYCWQVGDIDIPHSPTAVEEKHCKALRQLVGPDVPYLYDTGRKRLTLESALFHEGIKSATALHADEDIDSRGRISLSVVWAMAALALTDSGRSLSMKVKNGRENEELDYSDFRAINKVDLLDAQGDTIYVVDPESKFDYARQLFDFFCEVREHTDNSEKGIESECFIVYEHQDQDEVVGIEFSFEEWPLQGGGKRYALQDGIMWHLMMKTVQGKYGHAHTVSRLLAECIGNGDWRFEADNFANARRLLFEPEETSCTIVRFCTSGLRFLIKR